MYFSLYEASWAVEFFQSIGDSNLLVLVKPEDSGICCHFSYFVLMGTRPPGAMSSNARGLATPRFAYDTFFLCVAFETGEAEKELSR